MEPKFLLLAIWIHWASATCFINTTSYVKREVVDHPAVVDEYHCKILCAERIYDNECFLLGEEMKNVGYCIKPYQEWFKWKNDQNCPDAIDQTLIDTEYVPNPALALAIPQYNVITFNTLDACPRPFLTDLTLPNNTHLVEGNCHSIIEWDDKLGSWKFIKENLDGVNTTTYIRAARCYSFQPNQFTDTTSCGTSIPTMEPREIYKITGTVERFGVKDYCPTGSTHLQFNQGCNNMAIIGVQNSMISCVDGSWIMYGVNSAVKFTEGICVTRI